MKSKKLKEQYVVSKNKLVRYYFSNNPYRRNNFCRCFSTKQERSFAEMHESEYFEFGLKVRNRRAAGLPSSWDDLPSSLHDVEKCWKNNSRRKHQWFRTKEIVSMFD